MHHQEKNRDQQGKNALIIFQQILSTNSLNTGKCIEINLENLYTVDIGRGSKDLQGLRDKKMRSKIPLVWNHLTWISF